MKRIHTLILLSLMMLLASCERLALPSQNEASADAPDRYHLTVRTRSISDDIQYPVLIYAFDANGKCAMQQTIESETTPLSLALPYGKYHIVAISKSEGYTFPASTPTLTSLIAMASESHTSSLPLQMGEADVNLTSDNQSVSIIVSYQVASLNIQLSAIPQDVHTVTLSVGQQYSAINMGGEYSSKANAEVTLKREGNIWTSGDVYVFPGANTQTVFSISLTDGQGTSTYGYTYSSPLQPGTPYRLSGTYTNDMLTLSGSLSSKGWGTPIELTFAFGSNNTSDPSSGPEGGEDKKDEDIPAEGVSEFPVAGTFWNGHLVACVLDSDGSVLSPILYSAVSSATLILLSLQEWNDVYSANSDNPSEARAITSRYKEGDLGGWDMPTSFEAKILQNLYYGDNLEALNKTLLSAGGAPITYLKDNGEYWRFLCEDATYTFAWKDGGGTSKAGAKTAYMLRAVRRVTLKK